MPRPMKIANAMSCATKNGSSFPEGARACNHGADHVGPVPATGELLRITRYDGNRQHHQRNDADFVRGQKMSKGKAKPAYACQHGRQQEESVPTVQEFSVQHPEHNDQPRTDANQADHHVHCGVRLQTHAKHHGFVLSESLGCYDGATEFSTHNRTDTTKTWAVYNERVPIFEGTLRIRQDAQTNSGMEFAGSLGKDGMIFTIAGKLEYQACDKTKYMTLAHPLAGTGRTS